MLSWDSAKAKRLITSILESLSSKDKGACLAMQKLWSSQVFSPFDLLTDAVVRSYHMH